ncbi:hypothetical protein ABRP24_012515 [Curtobacterium sp. WHRI 8282]|uniref:hypothetical protein n=1 Tax=Curtobacterium sp. WHRI 8282 TaxID=3162559 RepID=UPI0032EF0209
MLKFGEAFEVIELERPQRTRKLEGAPREDVVDAEFNALGGVPQSSGEASRV